MGPHENIRQDFENIAGPVLGGQVGFMLARPQLPPLGLLPDLGAGTEREAVVGVGVLDDWTTRFVVQAAVPDAQRVTLQQDGRQQHVLVDVESGSWAALHEENGRWIVRQGGGVVLWDMAEEQLGRWHAAGGPAEFTITVSADGQSCQW